MKSFLVPYLAALVSLFAVDGIWLSAMGKNFYARYLSHLFAESPRWSATIVFYFLYALGITVLVVMPAIKRGDGIGKTIMLGALLGAVAYGAYDFTNQATLRDWPMIVTAVDFLWGTVLTAAASTIAFYAARFFG